MFAGVIRVSVANTDWYNGSINCKVKDRVKLGSLTIYLSKRWLLIRIKFILILPFEKCTFSSKAPCTGCKLKSIILIEYGFIDFPFIKWISPFKWFLKPGLMKESKTFYFKLYLLVFIISSQKTTLSRSKSRLRFSSKLACLFSSIPLWSLFCIIYYLVFLNGRQ